MIYKQIIPPAPAYMGLNLFLKGSQLVAKPTSKREKFRDELRVSSRSSYSSSKSKQQHTINIGSTGPVIVDFMECLNMKPKTPTLLTSSNNELRRLNGAIVLKKPNPFPSANLVKLNAHNKYLNNRSSITRPQNSKSCEMIDKVAKAEFVRRHASCGPKYIPPVTATTDESLTSPSDSDSKSTKKDLECIGNKCLDTLEWDNNNNNTTSCSSMNMSLPSSVRPHPQALEHIYKSKSAPTITGHLKSVRKFQLSNQFNHYRKLGSSNHECSNTNPNSPIKSGVGVTSKIMKNNCSHFFAVGLSVKAWRAKYNRIMKSQKENVQNRQLTPVASSCPSSIISRNGSKKIARQIQEI